MKQHTLEQLVTKDDSNLTIRINGHKINSDLRNKETLSLESMSRCARFDFCSAPRCPLDILVKLRTETETDPRCEMAKATRHKYWKAMPENLRYSLKFEGFFESEYNRIRAAKERWLALPEQKKAEIRERMRNVKHG